jgi:allophanate hydrolase
LISTSGVVPACRSLDCVSVFALSCSDAWRVFEVACQFDPEDPFARERGARAGMGTQRIGSSFRFGLPEDKYLEFFGDAMSRAAFSEATAMLQEMGGQPVAIDFAPFREAAQLLYDGPWIVERLVAAGQILAESPDCLDACVRSILGGAQRFGALDAFRAQERLRMIDRRTQAVWRDVDVLVTPTAATIYTVDQIKAEPLSLNTNLGYYTNFVNLLDLCALAVPSGFRPDNLPFGITFMAPHGKDAMLTALGTRFHTLSSHTVGILQQSPSEGEEVTALEADSEGICLAVVGAHLSGQPLNYQLVEMGATFVRSCRTAPHYRLFELPDMTPSKPGLVRCKTDKGAAIELEIWQLSPEAFGLFVSRIPAPLCIGSIETEAASWVQGFLCEHHAIIDARDISSFGGWRPFRRSLVGKP